MPSEVPVRDLRITRVAFMPAPYEERRAGLWGWASLTIDDALLLDAIGVRRTKEGAWTLSFPDRKDRAGVWHPVVRPLDQRSRAAIESQVIATLRRGAYLP
jgi:DNA-binding cell septation regulator SpoVG